MKKRALVIGVGLLLSSRALANAPAPASYWIAQESGNVRICLSDGRRTCPDDGLLRRDVQTGTIVEITACDVGGCFVDECVAAGVYQYGLRTPFACAVSGSYYYREVSVPGAPPACTPALPPPVPASSVPWSQTDVICGSTYDGPVHPYGCATHGGAVLGLDGLAVGLGLLLARRRRTRRGQAA